MSSGETLISCSFDLPPGTSDEPLSVVQLIPELAGAIIVTTPQEVALLDSRKAVNMVKAMKLPVTWHHREHVRPDLPALRREHQRLWRRRWR